MNIIVPITIVTLLIILIAIKIYNIANPKIKNNGTKHKKNKYYNPENNYFRNNPEHVDMTESYIDSIWNEMKKK